MAATREAAVTRAIKTAKSVFLYGSAIGLGLAICSAYFASNLA